MNLRGSAVGETSSGCGMWCPLLESRIIRTWTLGEAEEWGGRSRYTESYENGRLDK